MDVPCLALVGAGVTAAEREGKFGKPGIAGVEHPGAWGRGAPALAPAALVTQVRSLEVHRLHLLTVVSA